jgi:hypothetical protein
MIKGKIKNFDPDKEEAVNVTSDKKDFLSKKELFKNEDNEIKKHLFTVFHIEYLCEKYGVTQHNILLLLYLKELGVFGYTIDVLGKSYGIKDLILIGCVSLFFERKGMKSLYKITSFGNEIIDDYLKSFEKTERFVSDEKLKKDSNVYLKSVLENYFD